MLELVAVGPETSQSLEAHHARGAGSALGPFAAHRLGGSLGPANLREHADLVYRDGRLRVKCLDTALNPTYRFGAVSKDFTLTPGEDFRIGSTTFKWKRRSNRSRKGRVSHTSSPLAEYSFKQEEVDAFDFRNADHRLEVLWNLPRIISVSPTPTRSSPQHLVGLLLDGVPRAEAAAVVQYNIDATRRAGP